MLSTKLRWLVCLVGFGVLIFLATFRQPYFPTTWFDEGLVLQGAINLVQHGQYAMRSVEGFRVLDQPLTANGPGIVLPISAMFAVFGVGLLQARLLMAVYFVFAIILFNRVTKLLYGETAALISIIILLAVPDEGFILFGRQALGNVPALMYFLAGCYFFILLVERKSNWFAFLSGLFWGITLVTKSQYWVILPVLAALLLLDLIYYKQIGIKSGILVLTITFAGFAFWQLIQLVIIGSENYGQYVEAIRSSAKQTVFAFRTMRIPGNIWYLVRSGFPVFVIPGLTIAFLDSRREHRLGIVRAFLVLFVVTWSLWYVFVSVGWHRYAFEAYSLGVIFFGVAFLKAFQYILKSRDSLKEWTWQVYLVNITIVSFLILSTLWSVYYGYRQIQRILLHADSSPQLFAEYLRKNIPSDAVVESWEWEIDALTPGWTYHHPTNDWVDRKTAETQFGEVFSDKYGPLAFNPAYLIDGPFSKFTELYSDAISGGCCTRVIDIGSYTLYEIKNEEK